MQKKFTILIAVLVVSVLYVIGGTAGDQCSSIGNCKACWKTVVITVNSTYCPTNAPCIAQPYQQQRNALVDMLTCACSTASFAQYQDATINRRIEEVVKEMTGATIDAQSFCEDQYGGTGGFVLTKYSYG